MTPWGPHLIMNFFPGWPPLCTPRSDCQLAISSETRSSESFTCIILWFTTVKAFMKLKKRKSTSFCLVVHLGHHIQWAVEINNAFSTLRANVLFYSFWYDLIADNARFYFYRWLWYSSHYWSSVIFFPIPSLPRVNWPHLTCTLPPPPLRSHFRINEMMFMHFESTKIFKFSTILTITISTLVRSIISKILVIQTYSWVHHDTI